MVAPSSLIMDQVAQLHDGRGIGIAAVGQPDGFPILHMHGSGSSRLEVRLAATAAAAAGVRLIGLDRPGCGRSDPRRGFRLLDWAADVSEVADLLGLERFAIQGISAGGPYALACAWCMPQRLTACGLISSVPPPTCIRQAGPFWMRLLWSLGALIPQAIGSYGRLVQHSYGTDPASIERALLRYARRLGAADQEILSQPVIRRLLVEAMIEGLRQGGAGQLESGLAEIQPWGFEIARMTFEPLFIWHGCEDRLIPPAAAHLFAQMLPQATATFYEHEGHFSTPVNHVREILSALRRA
jgi:pimeloyl-ACP methyl ester carboxylesterase